MGFAINDTASAEKIQEVIIMALFGKKNQRAVVPQPAPQPAPRPMTEEEVNQMLSKQRVSMNQIIRLLEKIDYVKIRKKNSQEILPDSELSSMRAQVSALIQTLQKENAAKLVKMNVEKIDRELLYFADHLEDALVNGNINTAKVCLEGLHYGIVKAHQDIRDTDADRADKIIELRIKKIEAIRDIAQMNARVDESFATIKKLKEQKNKIAEEYNASKQELNDDKIRNKHIYDKIDRLAMDGIEPLDADVRDTARRLSSLHKMRVNYDALSDKVSHYAGYIDDIQNSIRVLENKAYDADVEIDMDYNELVLKASNDIARKMDLMNDAMVESNRIFMEMEAEFERIRARTDVKEAIISDYVAVQNELEKDRIREEEKEKGQKELEKAKMEQVRANSAKIAEQERLEKQRQEELESLYTEAEDPEEEEEDLYNPMLISE